MCKGVSLGLYGGNRTQRKRGATQYISRERKTKARQMRLKKRMIKLYELIGISRMIIKVKPCFSNPKRGGNVLNPRKGEGVAEYALRLLC